MVAPEWGRGKPWTFGKHQEPRSWPDPGGCRSCMVSSPGNPGRLAHSTRAAASASRAVPAWLSEPSRVLSRPLWAGRPASPMMALLCHYIAFCRRPQAADRNPLANAWHPISSNTRFVPSSKSDVGISRSRATALSNALVDTDVQTRIRTMVIFRLLAALKRQARVCAGREALCTYPPIPSHGRRNSLYPKPSGQSCWCIDSSVKWGSQKQ